MGRFFKRVKGALSLAIFAIVSQFPQIVSASDAPSAQCIASDEYLAELKRYATFINIEKDFSCLTDIPSLGQKLSSFQIIDVRSRHAPLDVNIKDAWIIPVSELKNKSFLQNKSLLLIGDGFSRANAARDCAILKKSGFTATKILVGGFDLWSSIHAKENRQSNVIESVSAQQLIFEYFNNRVSIVSTSKAASSKLSEMGLTKFYSFESADPQKISDLVLTQSNSGFDPVVIVGESGGPSTKLPLTFHNLYQLSGGVDALRQQLQGDVLVNRNRTQSGEGHFCGKR